MFGSTNYDFGNSYDQVGIAPVEKVQPKEKDKQFEKTDSGSKAVGGIIGAESRQTLSQSRRQHERGEEEMTGATKRKTNRAGGTTKTVPKKNPKGGPTAAGRAAFRRKEPK